MPSILQKTLSLLIGDDTVKPSDWLKMPKSRPLNEYTARDLINLESEIGRHLFGPIPKGHRREFFCLDDKTWIWHEEWLDEARALKTATTRYEIQKKGILKVQSGSRYTYIEGDELRNFIAAVEMYYEQVSRRVYNASPDSVAKRLQSDIIKDSE